MLKILTSMLSINNGERFTKITQNIQTYVGLDKSKYHVNIFLISSNACFFFEYKLSLLFKQIFSITCDD